MHAEDVVASYAPAPWTLIMRRASPKSQSDLRSGKATQFDAPWVVVRGRRKLPVICGSSVGAGARVGVD